MSKDTLRLLLRYMLLWRIDTRRRNIYHFEYIQIFAQFECLDNFGGNCTYADEKRLLNEQCKQKDLPVSKKFPSGIPAATAAAFVVF